MPQTRSAGIAASERAAYTRDMTTPLQIDSDLVRQAEAFAAQTGQDLSALVEDALRKALPTVKTSPNEESSFEIPSYNLRVKPGVDISNNAQLRDLMDADDEKLRHLYRS